MSQIPALDPQAAAALQARLEEAILRNPGEARLVRALGELKIVQGDLPGGEALLRRLVGGADDDPDLLTTLGRLALSRNDLAQAEADFGAALAAYPADVVALIELGRLEFGRGALRSARERFDRAVALSPGHAEARFFAGLAASQEGDHAAAIDHHRNALAIRPDFDEAREALGIALGQVGRKAERIALYREATTARPDAPSTWLGLSAALMAAGETEEALAAAEHALTLAPDLVQGLRARAMALLALKRRQEAVATLERALTLAPEDPEVSFALGNAHLSAGANAEARAAYLKAEAARPGVAEILNNLATAESGLGLHQEAHDHLRAALAVVPDFANAWNNLGIALTALDRPKDAMAAYRRAFECDPKAAGAMVNLAGMLRHAAALDEAAILYERAIAIEPSAQAHNGLGQILQAHNRQNEAIAEFEKALALEPANAHFHNNIAIAHQEMGRYAEAFSHYMKAIELDPGLGELYYNMATLVQLLGRYDEVVSIYRKALALRPDMKAIYPNLAHVQMTLCQWDNLDSVLAKVVENTEAELAAGEKVSTQYFAMLGMPTSAALRLKVARQLSRHYADKVKDEKKRLAFTYRRDGKKLRVGFISPDFRLHSVAAAFRGLLEVHDRKDFEWYGYSLAPFANDEFNLYFQSAFHRYRDISRATFPDAARAINEDGVQVLIDLAGHTRNNRFEVLALEPAPVQAHYLGFSATLGADYIRWLIVDPVEMPPELRAHCSEAVVLLPHTFMATTDAPISEKNYTRTDQGLPETGVVFCNFNAHNKFHPAMFDLWMRLLRRVPGSVMWFLEGLPEAMRNLRAAAEARNVDPDRIIFAGKLPLPFHLARLGLADIGLDNLYHAGGVTTVDAMRVGLPVVTLAGDTPNARTGCSIVAAMGAPELIGADLDAYEKLALSLAIDRDRRESLRAKLLANRATAPLFDMPRLARHLETAYRMMWERYLEGRQPEGFAVPE